MADALKIPNFGDLENALSTLFLQHTLSRIKTLEVEDCFRRDWLELRLTQWITAVLTRLREELEEHVEQYVRLTATEYVTSFVLPMFHHELSSACLFPQHGKLAADGYEMRELTRPLVFQMTLRLVRPTEYHAYRLVTVNGILEEVSQMSVWDFSANVENLVKPWSDDREDDDEDNDAPRPDVAQSWCRHYTLVGDHFEKGTTRVLTDVDLIHNLTRQDIVGEMSRTLFGLENVSIDDIDFSGEIRIRTYEKESQVVNGT